MRRALGVAAVTLSTMLLASACDSNESTDEGGPDHTPVRVVFAVNGTQITGDTLFLPAGQTVTVRGTFYNAADDDLDDVETTHFSKLTFNPGTLGTATVDLNAHYTHSVQVQGAATSTGTVDVGYGHDELADEHTLTGIPVKIQ